MRLGGLGLAKVRVEVEALEILFRSGGGGWEDELKNKTNLSQRLVEVKAELGKKFEYGARCGVGGVS